MGGAAGLAARSDFTIGTLTVKPSECAVQGPGGAVHLEPRVMQVLIALHEARGTTLTRDMLIDQCWGRIVGDDALTRVILQIRKVARDYGGGSFQVVTVPKVGYRLQPGAGDAPPPPTVSIAVMPFEAPGADEPYFAEGLAEEISSSLARQPGLRVAGRTSSWLLRDARPQEVAARLGVAYLVEGRVRQIGDRFRILVQVTATATELQVWRDEFEGELGDVFAIQTRIAQAVAASVRHSLVLDPSAAPPQSRSGEAYQLFLAGKALLRVRSPGRLASAVDLLRRAVALDPDFAPARSRLGIALSMVAMMHADPAALAAGRREAVAQARHALSLAPDSPDVQADYGALMYQDDIHSALAHLESARVLGEDSSEFWFWLAFGRDRVGDYRGAFAAHRRTVERDPLWLGAAFCGLAALDAGLEETGMAWLEPFLRPGGDPSARLSHQARLALFRNDYPTALRLAGDASAKSDPDLAVMARTVTAKALIGLGLAREARRAAGFLVTEREVMLRGGEVPPDLGDAPFGGDRRWYRVNPERYLVQRLWLRQGRPEEVVALCRRTVGPSEALEQHPDGHEAFLFDAAILARALQDCGAGGEADRLLAHARRRAEESLRQGMAPRSHHLAIAQLAGVAGQEDEAVRSLRQVLLSGVSPYHPAHPGEICEDPCFDRLRGADAFQDLARAFGERHASRREAVLADASLSW